VVAHVDDQLPVEDVERLLLTVVHVQRRWGADKGLLHQRVPAGGIGGDRLERVRAAEHVDGGTLSGMAHDRLVGDRHVRLRSR
jgi:hypothetical protein